MADIAVFLHSGTPHHRDLLPADVDWIEIDAGPLLKDVPSGQLSVMTFARLAFRLAGKRGEGVRRALDAMCEKGGRLVLCTDDAALALAVAARKLLGKPVVPMLLAGEAGIPSIPGKFGAWFRNRACQSVIATSWSAFPKVRDHRDGSHRLLSRASPLSDDPAEATALLRKAVTILAQEPGGDQHIRLACVNHVYFNQRNPDTLFALLNRYASYSPELLDRVHFVIVDDGSPITYDIPDLDLNLTWLKIDQDIRWNMAGARNLAAVYARADKIFMSDVDIEVPEHTMRYFSDRPPYGNRMYRPARIDKTTGASLARHPNAFLMSRARFMRFFGYDEEFSGEYGFEDLRIVKDQKLYGTFLGRLPSKWFVYERNDIDSKTSYHSLYRDESTNAFINARKTLEYEWYGRHGGHSRRNLQFTWTVLLDRRRKRPPPKIDRWFKPTWLLRQLHPD